MRKEAHLRFANPPVITERKQTYIIASQGKLNFFTRCWVWKQAPLSQHYPNK